MSHGADRTHYQVLGVSPKSGDEAIRAAYLGLARLLHPDRLGDSSPAEARLAERRMREVNQAWAVLRDRSGREAYDAELKRRPPLQSPTPPVPPHRPRPAEFTATPADSAATTGRRFGAERAGDDPGSGGSAAALGRTARIRAIAVPLIIAAAIAMFIFTAYAKSTGPATTTTTVAPTPAPICLRSSVWGPC